MRNLQLFKLESRFEVDHDFLITYRIDNKIFDHRCVPSLASFFFPPQEFEICVISAYNNHEILIHRNHTFSSCIGQFILSYYLRTSIPIRSRMFAFGVLHGCQRYIHTLHPSSRHVFTVRTLERAIQESTEIFDEYSWIYFLRYLMDIQWTLRMYRYYSAVEIPAPF